MTQTCEMTLHNTRHDHSQSFEVIRIDLTAKFARQTSPGFGVVCKGRYFVSGLGCCETVNDRPINREITLLIGHFGYFVFDFNVHFPLKNSVLFLQRRMQIKFFLCTLEVIQGFTKDRHERKSTLQKEITFFRLITRIIIATSNHCAVLRPSKIQGEQCPSGINYPSRIFSK